MKQFPTAGAVQALKLRSSTEFDAVDNWGYLTQRVSTNSHGKVAVFGSVELRRYRKASVHPHDITILSGPF
jgi:hypothetical protein